MMEERRKKRPVDDFAWQEYDTDEFKEMFPELSRELDAEGVRMDAYRQEGDAPSEEMDFSGYKPDVIDFLRRCETDDEALEIINWLEKRGEITSDMAKDLRITLVQKGVRAFGSKKEWGWYEKHRKKG